MTKKSRTCKQTPGKKCTLNLCSTDQFIHSLLTGIIPFSKASNKLATTTRCVLMLPTINNGPSTLTMYTHQSNMLYNIYVYTCIQLTSLIDGNIHSAVRDLIEFCGSPVRRAWDSIGRLNRCSRTSQKKLTVVGTSYTELQLDMDAKSKPFTGECVLTITSACNPPVW